MTMNERLIEFEQHENEVMNNKLNEFNIRPDSVEAIIAEIFFDYGATMAFEVWTKATQDEIEDKHVKMKKIKNKVGVA